MRATLVRLTSECRAPASHASKIGPQLWSSESFRKRLQILRESALEQHGFPQSLYPLMPPKMRTTHIGEFVDSFKDVSAERLRVEPVKTGFTLNGRVKAVRRLGRHLMFIKVQQDEAMVQVLCRYNSLAERGTTDLRTSWDSFRKSIHQGDIYSFTGLPARTETGELSLEIKDIPTLLTPRLHQVPDSITDEHTLSRFPQLSLLLDQKKLDLLRLRSELEIRMQDYFRARGFTKVSTPIISTSVGGAVARPFVTKARDFPQQSLSLRIAQELDLKKLVAAGLDRVFEIGPVFRNEGVDATHNPEFTTCEFYEAYANIDDLIKSTKEMLNDLGEATRRSSTVDSSKRSPLKQFRTEPLKFNEISFIPTLEKALAERHGISIRFPTAWSDETLQECLKAAQPILKHLNHHTKTWPQLLDSLGSIALEPFLETPTFIRNYPAIMSPLAKSFVDPATGIEVAARAELFIDGIEYVNMYEEENDPFLQTRKFLQQRRYADQLEVDLPIQDIPDNASHEELFNMLSASQQYYIRVLELGMPPTGGWGCGIERLVMFFGNAQRISDVLPFGTLKTLIASGT